MNISIFKSLEEFCEEQKEFYALDFDGKPITKEDNGVWLIGPEGGFSEDERNLLSTKTKKILSFGGANILKSETAIIAGAALLSEL